MGVHLTFVRSTDLDEWSQKQIDAMRLGGNGNAREYFRKHGFTDLNGGTKLEKKYTSKAAITYKAELMKLVEAETIKREDASSTHDVPSDQAESNSGGSLLMNNLDMVDRDAILAEEKKSMNGTNQNNNILVPSATKASSLPGASKLVVVPKSIPEMSTTSTNTEFSTLRKPNSTLTTHSLLRKPASSKVKMGVKLTVSDHDNHTADGTNEETFEEVEDTQRAALEADRKAKQTAEDEAFARRLQLELK